MYNDHMNKQERDGVVSLVVTLFIMLIVSLLALSFATLMRREQRQALERQLNSQAFYAAETGINDTLKALDQNPTGVGDIDSCDSADQDKIQVNGRTPERVLDSTARIEYTCVFVDQSPTTLDVDVQRDRVSVIPINTTSALGTIRISWRDINGSSSYPNTPGIFPPLSGWSGDWPGMLRGQLIAASFPVSRATIQSDTFNFYTYPSTNAGSTIVANAANNGGLVEGDCDNPANLLTCEIVIDVSAQNRSNYVLVLKGIYDTSKVQVRARTISNPGSDAIITGSQVIIDATGRAQDVVKRIKVNAPITPDYKWPNFAIMAGDDLCKRLQVTPQDTRVSPTAVDSTGTVFNLGNDPSCDPTVP